MTTWLLFSAFILVLLAIPVQWWLHARSPVSREQGFQMSSRPPTRLEHEATRLILAGATDALMRGDPAFSRDRLLDRVRLAFGRWHEVVREEHLHRVEPFVSDGVYESIALRLRQRATLGLTLETGALSLDRLDLQLVEQQGPFETIRVCVGWSADQRLLDLGEMHARPLSEGRTALVQYWYLRRRTGTLTIPAGGLLEGRCPNCGAEVERGQTVTCAFCGSLLRSGEHDWVLFKVIEARDWYISVLDLRPGEGAMRRRDPDFNVRWVEDEALVIFWRLAAARSLSDVNLLRRVATDSFVVDLQRGLGSRPGSRGRPIMADIDIETVQPWVVLSGDETDRVLVQISYWFTPLRVSRGGRMRPGGPPRRGAELLVLSRSASARTDLRLTLTSGHCPSCGAADTRNDTGRCDYCGVTRNDGARSWVLERALARRSIAADRLMARSTRAAQQQDRRAGLGIWRRADGAALPPGGLALAIVADLAARGLGSAEADALLRSLARARMVSSEILVGLFRGKQPPEPPRIERPDDLLRALVLLSYRTGAAVGEVPSPELQDAFDRSAGALGLAPVEANVIIEQECRRLGRSAGS